MKVATNIYIGLGANLPSSAGGPVDTLDVTIRRLSELGFDIVAASSFYQTKPMPASDQPDFINAVVKAQVAMTPETILEKFQALERELGRKPAERWSARTLDIDLLAYGNEVLPDINSWRAVVESEDPAAILEEPVVPHPRLHKRAFVLIPLLDIAPDWQHPILKEDVRSMCLIKSIKKESKHVRKLEE